MGDLGDAQVGRAGEDVDEQSKGVAGNLQGGVGVVGLGRVGVGVGHAAAALARQNIPEAGTLSKAPVSMCARSATIPLFME